MKALVVNKNDLINNIDIIKKFADKNKNSKKPKIIAVVKGNGYGMGIIKYVEFLKENGINFFAVATLDEALYLRKRGIKDDILMLSSTSIKRDVELLIKYNIILTIGSKEAGNIAQNIAKDMNKKVKVHLKIDTGFGRYGFLYSEKEELVSNIEKWNNLVIDGMFSHLSLAFYDKDKYSEIQFKRFMKCVDFLKQKGIQTGILHICNSSAFFKYENMWLDAVRLGSAFLGRLAIPNKYGLRKIAYLKCGIAEIKTLPKGYNIGYSNSYITKKTTKVAIIPVGYADGFNVSVKNDMFRKRDKLRYIIRDIKDSFKDKNLYVNINDQKCRILGRIGMYHVTVDITGKDIKIDDAAIFDISPMYINTTIKREYKYF